MKPARHGARVLAALLAGLAVGCGSDTTPDTAPGAAPTEPAEARRSDVDVVLEGITGRQAVRQYKQARETLDRIKADRARDYDKIMGD